ncbi:MAG: DUF1599 domain-containing protein [Spirosomaceae bacterium]|nr:DUF1599 domain-containing protein [Spirosomataceae bacterium]
MKRHNPMTEEKVRLITDEIIKILIQKNQDYGGASFDLGMLGNMVHLWDKVSRYKTLVEKSLKNETPNFESIEDTLRDIIGYAIIGLIIIDEDKQV